MSNKYHIAATGKNAGQYVPCDAKVNCRIGGEHLNADQAQAKNIMLAGEALLDGGDSTSKFQTFMAKRREKAAAKKAAYDALPLYMKNPMFAPTDIEVCETCGGRKGYLGGTSNLPGCSCGTNDDIYETPREDPNLSSKDYKTRSKALRDKMILQIREQGMGSNFEVANINPDDDKEWTGNCTSCGARVSNFGSKGWEHPEAVYTEETANLRSLVMCPSLTP